MREFLWFVAVVLTMGFALRWKREETIRALGEEAGAYLRDELRRNARSQLVRVLGLSLIGAAGIGYGPRAYTAYMNAQRLDAPIAANVKTSVTRLNDTASYAYRSELQLTAYRLKGTAGTDTVQVGIPLASGFLDSATAAIDSVACLVEGVEVGCHVDVRETPNNAWPALWPNNSVRILEVAIPITAADTSLSLRFGQAATPTARMTEPSWVPTNPASSNIAAGDSIGFYPTLSGYHKTIAWCTDPGECLDTKGYGTFGPDLDQLNTRTSGSLPFDTAYVRFGAYFDMVHDSTKYDSNMITNVYDAMDVATIANTSWQGKDLSNATSSYSEWRLVWGLNNGSGHYNMPNFYDRGWGAVRHFMMGASETYASRGLSYVWHNFNIYRDCNQNGYNTACTGAYIPWNPEGALGHYWFTGDTVPAGTLVNMGADCVDATTLPRIGDKDFTEGEPRPITKCLLAAINTHLLGDTSDDWSANTDTMIANILGGDSYLGDGTWHTLVGSAYSVCAPTAVRNYFMHPMIFEALAKYDDEMAGYTTVTRDSLVTVMTATASFFHTDSTRWQPVAGMEGQFGNFFTGDNCTEDVTWYADGAGGSVPDSTRINLTGMYPIMAWWMYNETGTASWLTVGDSIFRSSVWALGDTTVAVNTTPPKLHTPKEQAEFWYWMQRGLAYREEGVGN